MKEIEMTDKDVVMMAFRAGKKREEGKPRPMIVKIQDGETRERVLANARKLAKKGEEWKRVYVAADMTWQQREEAKKQESDLREEAAQKNLKLQEEKNPGKWILVGPRGKRRIMWVAAEKKKDDE